MLKHLIQRGMAFGDSREVPAMPRPWMAGAIVLAVLLAACGFTGSREAASEVMVRYFDAIQNRNYTAAAEAYADSFFRNGSRETWEAQLEDYTRQLGDLESYEAVSWNVKKHVGADAGTFVKVVYRTRYSRRPAVEQFILKEANAGFRIIAHRIEARDLPQGETFFI